VEDGEEWGGKSGVGKNGRKCREGKGGEGMGKDFAVVKIPLESPCPEPSQTLDTD